MTEAWRTSPLHPAYEVSDLGRVRRVWTASTRMLTPYEGRHGYPKVQLGYRGQRIYVHKLVALTWLDPPAMPNWHVDHINFDRTDNRVVNLRWLPQLINSVRWAGREEGRNLWQLIADEIQPDDHVPMTEEEYERYDPTASGW